jgi:hypothetical protein
MGKLIKLIIDECLSEPVVESLRPFLVKAGVSFDLQSVVKYQREGVADKVWIPKIAADGGWVVISSDRGKRNKSEKVDEKLPYLCRLHRVTHVLLSGTIHNEKAFAKGQALVAVWQQLLEAGDVKRGTRFKLRRRSGCDGYVLSNDDAKQLKSETPASPV